MTARRPSRRTDLTGQTVVQLWVLTRLTLLAVCAWVVATGDRTWLGALSGWDVQHYITIARHGYADPLQMAFFPGLPALLRASTALGLPMEVGGVLIALTGSALATWALYRMFGGTVAALWLIAPTAVFTTVGYTEGPFCAAAFWAWERGRAGRWGQAAALAAVACSFRVSGLFLIVALAVLAMTTHLGPKKERLDLVLGRWVWLLIPLAALGGYLVYLHQISGSWTAWFSAQSQGWSRGFGSPVDSFLNTVRAAAPARWPDRPLVALVFKFEIVSMVLGTLVAGWMLVRRRWAEASWVGVQVVAFGITYWFMSVNRAVLGWFPLFVTLAAIVRWRPDNANLPKGLAAGSDLFALLWRAVVVLVLTASVALMLFWAWLYYTGQWAS